MGTRTKQWRAALEPYGWLAREVAETLIRSLSDVTDPGKGPLVKRGLSAFVGLSGIALVPFALSWLKPRLPWGISDLTNWGFWTIVAIVYLVFVLTRITVRIRQQGSRTTLEAASELANVRTVLLRTQLEMGLTTGKKIVTYAEALMAVDGPLTVGASDDGVRNSLEEGFKTHNDRVDISRQQLAKFIGVLVQHNIAERKIEVYQHLVEPQQYWNRVTVAPETERYLSKGTSTRFFLTDFGALVVKDLRRKQD